ncbi:MAG: amino-acid N-acetyltransferase, partial [Gammaproteobacteria bacterium]
MRGKHHFGKSMTAPDYVAWFRNAAPYIRAHRDKTFVLYVTARALAHETFESIAQDVALLATLGTRIVLVYDAPWHETHPPRAPDAQPGSARETPSIPTVRHATSPDTIKGELETIGRLRFRIEASVGAALARVPLASLALRVISGNFVNARPAGIHDGRDLGLTGDVRRIDADGITFALDARQVVLIPPIGHSPSGDVFRLEGSAVAAQIAIELRAQKFIVLDQALDLRSPDGNRIREFTLLQAREHLVELRRGPTSTSDAATLLDLVANACHLGVRRGHLLDAGSDGVLLTELLTRDGVGTMVAADVYDETRRATGDDFSGIVSLIEPLENAGALVHRPREQLARELNQFMVMDRDGTVIACAAVYPIWPSQDNAAPEFVEFACLAVH